MVAGKASYVNRVRSIFHNLEPRRLVICASRTRSKDSIGYVRPPCSSAKCSRIDDQIESLSLLWSTRGFAVTSHWALNLESSSTEAPATSQETISLQSRGKSIKPLCSEYSGQLEICWTEVIHPKPPPTALEASVHAVSLFENNPLFNAGIRAVLTRAGTIELEASVMVTRGYRKRGVGVSMLKHVRHPIKLAAEMLKRGNADDGGGAVKHCHLSGEEVEGLAESWGLGICEEKTFWTKKRWEEHKRGLHREGDYLEKKGHCTSYEPEDDDVVWQDDDTGWDGKEYLPQGTVGAVVLDAYGAIAVATSTGGLTNKLPGRFGDTPTIGAGFWAEEWIEQMQQSVLDVSISLAKQIPSRLSDLLYPDLWQSCLQPWRDQGFRDAELRVFRIPLCRRHAVAMSGTGNGDSFLKLCAVRSAAIVPRFTPRKYGPSLQAALTAMAGPDGELQRSAGSYWGKTGEGEGGIIGIELIGTKSYVCADFNKAMFRAWVDDAGTEHCMVFREEY